MISYPRFINSKVIKQHEQKINDERNLTMSFTKIILADGSGTEMIFSQNLFRCPTPTCTLM